MKLNNVNAKQLRQMIRLCTAAGKTLYIEGAPGCGKTAIVRDELRQMGRPVVYECAAYLTQANFGLPCPDGDWLRVLRPQRWFKTEGATLVFDEADKLSPMLQQQMAQAAHERRLGDDHMPPGTSVILIGNRTTDANGSYGVSNILSSRTARVEYTPTPDEVLSYAHVAGWHPLLTAVLEMHKSLVNKPEASKDRFPCSRAWENASAILRQTGEDRSMWVPILSAHVGDEATAIVEAVMMCYDELTPAGECFRQPLKAGIPESPAARMLQATIITSEASTTTTGQAVQYLTRMPREVALSAISWMIQRYPHATMEAVREHAPSSFKDVIRMHAE